MFSTWPTSFRRMQIICETHFPAPGQCTFSCPPPLCPEASWRRRSEETLTLLVYVHVKQLFVFFTRILFISLEWPGIEWAPRAIENISWKLPLLKLWFILRKWKGDLCSLFRFTELCCMVCVIIKTNTSSAWKNFYQQCLFLVVYLCQLLQAF